MGAMMSQGLPRPGEADSSRYYDLLGVTPDEVDKDADCLKKSYRKKAIRLHPDKLGHLSAEEQAAKGEEFRSVQTAYEVLSDEMKRAVYDDYGEQGVAMYEQGVFGDDLENLKMMQLLSNPLTTICGIMLVGVILGSVFVQILIAGLKSDGDIPDGSWPVVMIPLWILLTIFGCFTCLRPQKLLKKAVAVVQWICLVTFCVLLAVNLELSSDDLMPWGLVFIPVFIWELLHFLSKVPRFTPAQWKKATGVDEELEEGASKVKEFTFGCGYPGWVIKNVVLFELIRLAFFALFVVKLSGVDFTWWIVSIPLFLYPLYWAFCKVADSLMMIRAAKDADPQTRQQINDVTIRLTQGLVCILMVVVLTVGLFFGHVASAGTDSDPPYSATVSLIPPLVFFGLLCCCCMCCGPICMCAACVDPNDLDNPEFAEGEEVFVEKSSSDGEGAAAKKSGSDDNAANEKTPLVDSSPSTPKKGGAKSRTGGKGGKGAAASSDSDSGSDIRTQASTDDDDTTARWAAPKPGSLDDVN